MTCPPIGYYKRAAAAAVHGIGRRRAKHVSGTSDSDAEYLTLYLTEPSWNGQNGPRQYKTGFGRIYIDLSAKQRVVNPGSFGSIKLVRLLFPVFHIDLIVLRTKYLKSASQCVSDRYIRLQRSRNARVWSAAARLRATLENGSPLTDFTFSRARFKHAPRAAKVPFSSFHCHLCPIRNIFSNGLLCMRCA